MLCCRLIYVLPEFPYQAFCIQRTLGFIYYRLTEVSFGAEDVDEGDTGPVLFPWAVPGAGYHATFPLIVEQLGTSPVSRAAITTFWVLIGFNLRSATPWREMD